ncbi:uncharacterized protein [Ptychodera flava]|uniref:uncharacterized protein n=1 Tax=Ptychodera flava TaxID=63121 RepID=UPI00396A9260
MAGTLKSPLPHILLSLCLFVALDTRNSVFGIEEYGSALSGTWKCNHARDSTLPNYLRVVVKPDHKASTIADSEKGAESLLLRGSSISYNSENERMEERDLIFALRDQRIKVLSKESTLYGKMLNCSCISWEDGSTWVKVQDVNHVHVVYMNHLDVGYNGLLDQKGFINNVLNRYFNVYYPRAIRVADTLRSLGGRESLVYTTHPWLVSLYVDCPENLVLAGIKLNCPSRKELDEFEKAVGRGDIAWHAGPMNIQTDNIDESLFDYALTISEDLDKKFGIQRKHRGFSQRDVPGITQATIPTLVKHGIEAVSVGVNSMSSPPAVPNPFVWKYGNDSVLAMWHPGGYPNSPGTGPLIPGGLSRNDCVLVDGLDHALCFAFRNDNSGPPLDALEVNRYYSILDAEFPGATIRGSTFEDYISALMPFKDKLPVLEKEIGDTWIQGIMSDPKKMAQYRAFSRARSQCIKEGQCDMSDPRLSNSSRFLLKISEHTYGLNGVSDHIHWKNKDFHENRKEKTFELSELSWKEQREFVYLAVDALQDHPLAKTVEKNFKELEPSLPDTTGYKTLSIPTAELTCNGDMTIQIGRNGQITKLLDHRTMIDWSGCSSGTCGLGLMMYNSYNDSDINNFSDQYDYHGVSAGFHKNGMTEFARPESHQWIAKAVEILQKKDGSCSFLTKLSFTDNQSWMSYGAPQSLWVRTDVNMKDGKQGVDLTVQYFNKTSTRLPESLMYNFFPAAMSGYQWQLDKMGRAVDPMNVVLNGSQMVHGITEGIRYLQPGPHGIEITSPDVPVVGIVTKDLPASPYTVPLKPLSSQPIGMAYNFFNNVWSTNYIFWYPYMDGDENFKARFRINLS